MACLSKHAELEGCKDGKQRRQHKSPQIEAQGLGQHKGTGAGHQAGRQRTQVLCPRQWQGQHRCDRHACQAVQRGASLTPKAAERCACTDSMLGMTGALNALVHDNLADSSSAYEQLKFMEVQ